jgi:hypothetical protein
MATSNIIDFGSQHSKRKTPFERLRHCLRHRGIFRTIRWYYRQWRYGSFNEVMIPIINKTFAPFDVKEFVSVQPMSGPPNGLSIPWKVIDENNPEVGEVFPDKSKCGSTGCCWSWWHKIWTGSEWVFEKNISQEEWKTIVTKFHSKK